MEQQRLKRTIVGILLILLPVIAVFAVKKSKWGPLLTTPSVRIKGAAKAKVLIVEYSDFQCPSCARIQPVVHQLMTYYEGKVRLAFKYYPLTRRHPNAMAAAHAAQCAAEQNKFWPYHDRLFETQLQWAELADPTTSFAAIAVGTDLKMNAYETCVQDETKRQLIEADMHEGDARGVNSTPTFFVGEDRLVGGLLESDGARAIEKALRK